MRLRLAAAIALLISLGSTTALAVQQDAAPSTLGTIRVTGMVEIEFPLDFFWDSQRRALPEGYIGVNLSFEERDHLDTCKAYADQYKEAGCPAVHRSANYGDFFLVLNSAIGSINSAAAPYAAWDNAYDQGGHHASIDAFARQCGLHEDFMLAASSYGFEVCGGFNNISCRNAIVSRLTLLGRTMQDFSSVSGKYMECRNLAKSANEVGCTYIPQ